MGSVYQIKTGKHKGQWRGNANLPKKWNEEKGKYDYPKKVVYARSEPEAKRLVNEIENQVYKNRYVDSGSLTIGAYLESWFGIYCDGLAETTKALYKMYIDVHIVPEIGHIKLKELLPSDIQKYYNKKKKGGYKYKDKNGSEIIRPPLKGQTIIKIHTLLNKAFKEAVNDKLLYDNPCDLINRPKKEKYTHKVYNEEQMKRLLSAVEGTFDEVCITLAACGALRRGEVFGLRPIDVDFQNNTISIRETMTKFDKWLIKPPKSESGIRTIKVPSFVTDVVKQYLSTLKVVPERICGLYTPDSYSKHFKRLLEDNGLPHIRFHDLRHFAGSILSKYNVPKPFIKNYMGHADEQTTSIYTHAMSDMDDMAIDVMKKIHTENTPNKPKRTGNC